MRREELDKIRKQVEESGVGLDRSAYKRMLVAFYQVHNPDKLDELLTRGTLVSRSNLDKDGGGGDASSGGVGAARSRLDAILDKWVGREEQLLAKLRAMYGSASPSGGSGGPAQGQVHPAQGGALRPHPPDQDGLRPAPAAAHAHDARHWRRARTRHRLLIRSTRGDLSDSLIWDAGHIGLFVRARAQAGVEDLAE